MEEVSTMMRPALPGKSLTISSNSTGVVGAVRESPRQQTSSASTGRRDVLTIQASGSPDSGRSVGGGGGGGGHQRQTVSILAVAPTASQLPAAEHAAGATVFVGAGGTAAPAAVSSSSSSSTSTTSRSNATGVVANSPIWRRTSVPEVQTVNGYETQQQQQPQQQLQGTPVLGQRLQQPHQQPQQQQQQQQQSQCQSRTQSAHHVVKIRINPEIDTGRVISTVRLTSDEDVGNGVSTDNDSSANDTSLSTSSTSIRRDDVARVSSNDDSSNSTNSSSSSSSCVRISVTNGIDADCASAKIIPHREEMVQRHDSINAGSASRNGACFYYGSFRNSLGASTTTTTTSTSLGGSSSSGQCSPSDTLDSGTCSDLDGTPPPLPRKKKNNSSTVLLGVSGVGDTDSGRACAAAGEKQKQLQQQQQQHQRTGSLTSSGAEVDSDDNESNISCDSLNGVRVNGVKVIDDDDEDEAAAIVAEDAGSGSADLVNDVGANSDVNDVNVSNGNNNNNNDYSSNVINNNNKNNKNNNSVKVNATNGKNCGEEEMNLRNNGNAVAAAAAAAAATTESISGSGSIRGTSPSPSPSVASSSLSTASSTPRARSPAPSNGRVASPVVRECTYEERKREQDRLDEESAAAVLYANYNRKTGTKYLYDDDRFYKFHINENQPDANDDDAGKDGDARDPDEFFAGYKILDREAIRSAKGTVRGVKNRVRAGIATFLQKPSAKNYKAKDEGKIVVYTTSMSIVRETYFACIKMLQILKTHMVKYEVRDMFMSRELQTELKERIGCETIEVPQLFIDGQYIGNADAVERLNESGELRRMFKPYKSLDACTTCVICGGCRLLPCSVCNGSKKSPVRYDFMREFYWLRCMNCDEVGLVRCQHC